MIIMSNLWLVRFEQWQSAVRVPREAAIHYPRSYHDRVCVAVYAGRLRRLLMGRAAPFLQTEMADAGHAEAAAEGRSRGRRRNVRGRGVQHGAGGEGGRGREGDREG